MNLVIKDRKKMTGLLKLLLMFIIMSAVSFGNTQGGGTGIFDGLFDLLKKLIIDLRYLLILVGAIGIVVSIVMEIFMPDMARTIKVFVGSVVAVTIGIGGEIAVRQLGGSMLNSEYIMQGIEYVKISM
jgi:hypothetical protein